MLTSNKQKETHKNLTVTERFDRLPEQSCLEHSSTQIQCYEPVSLLDHIPCDMSLQLTEMNGRMHLTGYQSKLT